MPFIEIADNGEMTTRLSNKRSLSAEFDLHIRDLRPIFSLRQVSTIMRRGQAIVVNFKSIKMIIAPDRVLVFNLENPNVEKHFVPYLASALSTRDESQFELSAIDATLREVVRHLQRKFQYIDETSQTLLQSLESATQDETLTQLLHLKKRLSVLESRAQEVEDLINELLESDEELGDLLFESTKRPELLKETESILEDSLEQTEVISHQIDQLNENIDDTQEIISLRLASLRNRIIRFDLIISVITSIFALLAVVVGLYGVNLKNHLEESPWAFLVLTILLFVLSALVWGGIKRYMEKHKLL